jgi:hypothetical protein
MGFLEVLTIVFIVLKLMGIITWGWLAVFSPLMVSIAIYILWFLFVFCIVRG